VQLFVTKLRHDLCADLHRHLQALVEGNFGPHISVLVNVLGLLCPHVLLLHGDDVLLTFDEERVRPSEIDLKVACLLQLIRLQVRRVLVLELCEDLALLGTEFHGP
jgi:hypothetical protein